MAKTLLELIKEKNDRIDSIPTEFQSSVEAVQKKILNRIIELINNLDIKAGHISMTQHNLIVVAAIEDELKKIFNNKAYLEAVKNFSLEFEIQAQVNNEYFEKAFPDTFDKTKIANQIVKNSQANAINLLAGEPASQNFITPIRTQLEQAVASNASLSDTVASISEFVEGTEGADGRLLRYSKQVSWDSFAIADRSYTNAIAEDLDAEWFYYSGGLVKDSRCFCQERNNNYFHYKEIESWGRKENLGNCNTGDGWAGMNNATNEATIFILLGGWQCKHSLMPISISIVPQEAIIRAINKGYYNPD